MWAGVLRAAVRKPLMMAVKQRAPVPRPEKRSLPPSERILPAQKSTFSQPTTPSMNLGTWIGHEPDNQGDRSPFEAYARKGLCPSFIPYKDAPYCTPQFIHSSHPPINSNMYTRFEICPSREPSEGPLRFRYKGAWTAENHDK